MLRGESQLSGMFLSLRAAALLQCVCTTNCRTVAVQRAILIVHTGSEVTPQDLKGDVGSRDLHDEAFELHLYATLSFSLADATAASRFEVYHKYMSGGSKVLMPTDAAATSHSKADPEWTWTGTAFASEYRVCKLIVPSTADAVQFLVQPADGMSKLMPITDATVVTLNRP